MLPRCAVSRTVRQLGARTMTASLALFPAVTVSCKIWFKDALGWSIHMIPPGGPMLMTTREGISSTSQIGPENPPTG